MKTRKTACVGKWQAYRLSARRKAVRFQPKSEGSVQADPRNPTPSPLVNIVTGHSHTFIPSTASKHSDSLSRQAWHLIRKKDRGHLGCDPMEFCTQTLHLSSGYKSGDDLTLHLWRTLSRTQTGSDCAKTTTYTAVQQQSNKNQIHILTAELTLRLPD